MEWTIVTTIAALVALVTGIVTPIIKLNTTVVKLATVVEGLTKSVAELSSNAHNTHERIWDKVNKNTSQLAEHETRLNSLEEQRHKGE